MDIQTRDDFCIQINYIKGCVGVCVELETILHHLHNLDLEQFLVKGLSCFSNKRISASHLFYTSNSIVFDATFSKVSDIGKAGDHLFYVR